MCCVDASPWIIHPLGCTLVNGQLALPLDTSLCRKFAVVGAKTVFDRMSLMSVLSVQNVEFPPPPPDRVKVLVEILGGDCPW